MPDTWHTPTEHTYRLPGIPEIRPAGLTWRDRLDEWLELIRTQRVPELPHVVAGGQGELTLRTLVGQHASSRFGELFACKRVPRALAKPGAGRVEIDLIVVTPRRVIAFEAKHWSGRLRSDGHSWVYERRGGEIQMFDDLTAHHAQKVDCLRRYLVSQGVDLPAERFEHQVVFTHPRIELDKQLARHPRIVTMPSLAGRIPRLKGGSSLTHHLLAALIERCASQEAGAKLNDGFFDVMPSATTKAIQAAVARLRSWDVLSLHGGRELIGDLLWLRIGEQRWRHEQLGPGACARLSWRRSRVTSLLPLFGAGPFGQLKGNMLPARDLRTHDCLYFHEVGEPRPAVISLASIDRIHMG